MSYAQQIVGTVFQSAATARQMYTDWYAGEQAKQAYQMRSELTMREMEVEKLAIAGERFTADIQALKAKATREEASALEAAGRMKEEALQADTDTRAATLYARAAKYGQLVPGGSSRDILNAFADSRGLSLAQLRWQTEQGVYEKKVDAYTKEAQAALTLYGAEIREGNLAMYPYQAEIYRMSGDQAVKDATNRVYGDYLGGMSKVNDIWGGSGGGMGDMGGGSGAGGGG